MLLVFVHRLVKLPRYLAGQSNWLHEGSLGRQISTACCCIQRLHRTVSERWQNWFRIGVLSWLHYLARHFLFLWKLDHVGRVTAANHHVLASNRHAAGVRKLLLLHRWLMLLDHRLLGFVRRTLFGAARPTAYVTVGNRASIHRTYMAVWIGLNQVWSRLFGQSWTWPLVRWYRGRLFLVRVHVLSHSFRLLWRLSLLSCSRAWLWLDLRC